LPRGVGNRDDDSDIELETPMTEADARALRVPSVGAAFEPKPAFNVLAFFATAAVAGDANTQHVTE
jgi:hypothetical protein